MATGKTSVGKELAKRLKAKFLDMDDLIQEEQNMRIADIFTKKGEPHFRKLEKDLVKKISRKSGLVVSCGGGVVVDVDNLNSLKNSGLIVCLKADIETILERSKKVKFRPLLNVENPRARIEELLKKREPFYSQADYTIDTTNLAVGEAVDKIVKCLMTNKNDQ